MVRDSIIDAISAVPAAGFSISQPTPPLRQHYQQQSQIIAIPSEPNRFFHPPVL
ncbi:MAG: hypothetical protein M3044_00875 [Thermoproteota archaeon]|nr:hypothetical protein [Thermoproteota archaeon]